MTRRKPSGCPKNSPGHNLWVLFLFGPLFCSAPVDGADLRSALDLLIPEPPIPVNVGSDKRLVYELHLTDFSADAVALKGIEIRDPERGQLLGNFADADLDGLLGHPGQKRSPVDNRVIEPGMRAVCYFWLKLEPGVVVPRTLTHRVSFELREGTEVTQLTTEGGAVVVNAQRPPVLGPPLHGGPWVAVYDPAMNRGHRRMFFALDGHARIPARFAIDWFKVDPEGKLARGDETATSNWYGYGADVLAVANASVHAVRADLPESASVYTTGRPRNALQDGSGNFVVLDLGSRRYAFYEHLKPGSVRVRVGDHVVLGQVIGQVGYTGDSTGPHLHFHVADGPSALAAEGLPYVIGGYEVLGEYGSIDAFASGHPWTPSPRHPDRRYQQLPLANAVVQFVE